MVDSHRRGPDFVCIGAQKSGTTWVYDNLLGHPQVWLPPIKELHFFNRICPHEQLIGVEGGRGPNPRRLRNAFKHHPSFATFKWLNRFYRAELSTEYYYRLFEIAPAGKTLGEITPAYSTLDARGVNYARRTLKEGCKIILILRDPIERIWSGLKMDFRWRKADVTKASRSNILDIIDSPSMQIRTQYDEMVRLWRRAFGDDFHVLSYDDLKSDPKQFLESIQKTLQVDVVLDHDKLGRRSNADPRRVEIPDHIQTVLVERFQGMLENLEELLPGTGERWLDRYR